jgi:hypothetical protein
VNLKDSRSHFKKVFSSDIGVEPSYQVLDMLEYACGLILGLALIPTENPNFEMASRCIFVELEKCAGKHLRAGLFGR